MIIMAQKIPTYTTERSFEIYSTDRFVFFKSIILLIIFFSSIFSCSEPEIKLSRADQKTIDTLVNNQLDSISPILDSLCFEETDVIIKRAVDSIVKERQKQEERLRLNVGEN